MESFVSRKTLTKKKSHNSFFRHFNHRHAIYLEFLPQIIFLACIFFYLIILIFYKWTHFDGRDATSAPSLLIRKKKNFFHEKKILYFILNLIDLINMILLSYPSDPPSSVVFYSGQKAIQTILIILAVLCIPWMLLGKPVYRIVMNKRRANVSILLD